MHDALLPVRKSLFSERFSTILRNRKVFTMPVTPLPCTRPAALQIHCFRKGFHGIPTRNQCFPSVPRFSELMIRVRFYSFPLCFQCFPEIVRFSYHSFVRNVVFPKEFEGFLCFQRMIRFFMSVVLVILAFLMS